MANRRRQLTPQRLLFVIVVPLVHDASASQTGIAGPPGSVLFGSSVALLPNGNIVVADPKWTDGTTEELGAVYLYTSGGQLISKLTGSSADDDVGSQIVVLANGNFVVGSGAWNLSTHATHVGAVTWVNGTTGLSGAVSASNSLIGSQTNDSIGDDFGVFALPSGNYIVLSPSWANGSNTSAGAITWGSGTAGVNGAVSASNSLVGTHPGDNIGLGDDTNDHPRFTILSNGNAVVASLEWANNTGAATWIKASTGNHGAISSANSLVGAQAGDIVGYGDIVALANGNYVVSSPYWSNVSTQAAGAATWGNGSTGTSGVVSASNSLVGTHANDQVSVPGLNTNLGITALSNGNYVVASQAWNDGAGAATWANGATGLSATVTASNSLTGGAGDGVGYGVTALSNGDYVVASVDWGNSKGAVTWANGTTGLVATVKTSNSLTGSTPASGGPSVDGDRVGEFVTALTNGNYVVGSQFWNDGVGAATWLNGTAAFSGIVSTSNSLTGSVAGDSVSSRGIVALTNGNYVVISDTWNKGAATKAGAVTWGSGTAAMSGTVGTTNSLTGATSDDQIGDLGVFPLANGNYVVGSQNWSSSAAQQVGAVTWANGSHATAAAVSGANSLVGSSFEDWVGFDEILTFPNSNYLVVSFNWDNGNLVDAGAVTEGRANGGTVGALSSANSVLGTVAFDGTRQSYDYDASRDLLVVGQPVADIVFLFNSDSIFKNGFE